MALAFVDALLACAAREAWAAPPPLDIVREVHPASGALLKLVVFADDKGGHDVEAIDDFGSDGVMELGVLAGAAYRNEDDCSGLVLWSKTDPLCFIKAGVICAHSRVSIVVTVSRQGKNLDVSYYPLSLTSRRSTNTTSDADLVPDEVLVHLALQRVENEITVRYFTDGGDKEANDWHLVRMLEWPGKDSDASAGIFCGSQRPGFFAEFVVFAHGKRIEALVENRGGEGESEGLVVDSKRARIA